MARKLRDALPGGEQPLRAALWAFMRPILSPRLVELNKDAFVFPAPLMSTIQELGASAQPRDHGGRRRNGRRARRAAQRERGAGADLSPSAGRVHDARPAHGRVAGIRDETPRFEIPSPNGGALRRRKSSAHATPASPRPERRAADPGGGARRPSHPESRSGRAPGVSSATLRRRFASGCERDAAIGPALAGRPLRASVERQRRRSHRARSGAALRARRAHVVDQFGGQAVDIVERLPESPRAWRERWSCRRRSRPRRAVA